MSDRLDVLRKVSLVHCADHRLAMLRWPRSPEAKMACERWWGDADQASGYADLASHIGRAQMWWVAEDMQLLVEAATLSLPDFPLQKATCSGS